MSGGPQFMHYLLFLINSALLGVGLAMDAFSVSMANGLRESHMDQQKTIKIAGTFAGFQFLMPMIGWTCVHTILLLFEQFQKLIPWIALLLLAYIGGKMLWDGMHCEIPEEDQVTGNCALIMQGIATSIDALSVGFTIAAYHLDTALLASLIIAVVTFILCYLGVGIGKRFGTRLAGKATILGGLILIAIGLEIFISGIR